MLSAPLDRRSFLAGTAGSLAVAAYATAGHAASKPARMDPDF